MRSAILLAAGCALCLSQPGFAGGHFAVSVKFSKPDVSYSTFLHDRNACLGDASHQGWTTANGLSSVPSAPIYSVSRFGDCMLAKGYKPDPNGFFAAEFQHWTSGKYWLVRI